MKASEVKVTVATNADPEFYRLLGPFLGRREVAKMLGGPMWDDDGKTWFIAQTGTQVTGFVGVTTGRGLAVVESCYVDGDDRLAARLIGRAVAAANPTPCVATVRRENAAPYLAAGFVQAGETTNFVKLIRKGA